MPIADNAANRKRVELIEDLKTCWWSSFCTRVIALLQVLEVLKIDIALQFQQYACRLAEEHDRLISGTDQAPLLLHQTDLQAQINSFRESVSKALQLFLKDPDASLVDSLNLPRFEITVPQEAPTIDLSTDVATTFNTFFGHEQVRTWEPHLAQEYVTFFHSILNDLIYVVESRKPVDVTVPVIDSERLRRAVHSVQRLLGTTFNRADANEFGHLLQEVISDSERLFRHQLEHNARTPDFAKLLSINLDSIGRQISRFGQTGEVLNPVRLTQANWDLLIELVAAGKHGTTRKQLAEILNVTEREVGTRKTELKNAIASLGLTIPDDEFRLAMVAAHGNRLAWTEISINEATHQMTRAGKKYEDQSAGFPNARSSEPWTFAKLLMEAGGKSVDFAKEFPHQSQGNLRKIKERVSDELRKLDIAVSSSGPPSTWHAVDESEKA